MGGGRGAGQSAMEDLKLDKEFVVKYPQWFEILVKVSWVVFLGITVFFTMYFFIKGFTAVRVFEVVFFCVILVAAYFSFYFFRFYLLVTESGIEIVYKNGTRYHKNWQDITGIEKLRFYKCTLTVRIIRCRDGKNILVATDMIHYKELLEAIRQYVNTDIPVEDNFNSFQFIFVDFIVLLLAGAFTLLLNFIFKLKPQILTMILIGFFLIGSFIVSRFIKSR